MQRICFLGLCLLAVLQCDAAIYQWTDSTGAVQFSDRPPQEKVEVIERRDIETGAVVARPPAPQRAAKAPKQRSDSPRKKPSRAARVSEREQARQRCDKLRRRIDNTQSKLRAGYSAKRGIALTERLRADRDTLYRDCRYR